MKPWSETNTFEVIAEEKLQTNHGKFKHEKITLQNGNKEKNSRQFCESDCFEDTLIKLPALCNY